MRAPPPRLPSAPRPGTTHPDACPVTSPDPNGETLGTPGPAALTGQPPGRAVARGRAVLSGHGAAPRAPPRRRGLRHAWPRPAPGSRRRRAAEGGEGRGEGEDPALPARPGPPLPTSPPRPLPLPPPDVPPPDVCSPPPQTPGESFGDEGGEHNVTVPRPIPAPPPPPSPKKKPVCAPSFPQMCSPPPRADAPWAPQRPSARRAALQHRGQRARRVALRAERARWQRPKAAPGRLRPRGSCKKVPSRPRPKALTSGAPHPFLFLLPSRRKSVSGKLLCSGCTRLAELPSQWGCAGVGLLDGLQLSRVGTQGLSRPTQLPRHLMDTSPQHTHAPAAPTEPSATIHAL